MIDRIRTLGRKVAVAATALLVACESGSTAPIDAQDDAARAAQAFSDLADSVAKKGGDTDLGTAYSGIAGILRTGGRITPVVLTIDGVARSFMAAAMTVATTVNDCPKGAQCFAPPTTYEIRSLIAWDRDNPKRLLQLSSASNDEQIGAIMDPSALAIYARMASLIYMDGAGGTFIGTSGTQKFEVTKTDTPCPTPTDTTKLARFAAGSCTLADHSVAFSGKLEPSPFRVTSTTATTGTHTIAMAAQTVHGTHRSVTISLTPCDTGCRAPVDTFAKPPVVVRPSNELPAKLSAVVGSEVTLTFTVRNPSADPVKVVYPSGQKYDFVAIDSTTGKSVWSWSANKTFVQAVVVETVPGNGSLTFVEKWTPPSRGRYLVRASLTSTSHRSEAYAAVVVP